MLCNNNLHCRFNWDYYNWPLCLQRYCNTQLNKLNELKSRQGHEISKLIKEAEIKASANQFNAEQTKKQREWVSEADKLKNELERQNIRVKEAEVDKRISDLKKENPTKQKNIQS